MHRSVVASSPFPGEEGMDNSWFGLCANETARHADLAIFGVPYDGSVFFRRGAAEGPDRIRALSSKLPPTAEDGRILADRSILDLGNVEPDDPIENLHRKLGETWRAARERATPLVLGGDHSISIPLIAAA